MSKFTKEQLVEYVKGCIEHAERFPGVEIADKEKAIFEMALAALTADTGPVAYMYRDKLHTDARFSLEKRFGNWSQEDINEYEITEIPLYTAPPAPLSVPDEMYWQDAPVEGSTRAAAYATGWNACRAAMLLRVQGADHETD